MSVSEGEARGLSIDEAAAGQGARPPLGRVTFPCLLKSECSYGSPIVLPRRGWARRCGNSLTGLLRGGSSRRRAGLLFGSDVLAFCLLYHMLPRPPYSIVFVSISFI